MKILFVMLAILISSSIKAEVYFDVGLGVVTSNYYRYHSATVRECQSQCITYNTYEEADNPYGTLEIGYTKNNISLYFIHLSSIPDKDGGLNMAGIKYRFKVFE